MRFQGFQNSKELEKMKISNKWLKMAEIYKSFSQIKRVEDAPKELIKIWNEYDAYRDYSDEAMFEAYEKESLGKDYPIVRNNRLINGYIEGKKLMDLTITDYWIPDILNKECYVFELYQEFPKWFIDKVIPERYHLTEDVIDSL